MDLKQKFKLVPSYVEQSSIWEDLDELAEKYKPVNVGIGCANFLPSQHVLDALIQTINSKDAALHQCTRSYGHPRLIKALAKLYSPLINHNIDPYQEIITCAGAYGALYATIMGHVQQGDEVIIIEPFFDCYEFMVNTARGTIKYIPLQLKNNDGSKPASFVLDFQELENLFNTKTKAIILNTPNNPLGKVFDEDELLKIAHLCIKWNVMCIADEVYEWLTYGSKRHIKIASLPGMWERTITIGSGGKTFCVTGWKIGWAIGPKYLIENLQAAPSFVTPTFIQEAIAIAIEKELTRIGQTDCYLISLGKTLRAKEEYLFDVLLEFGLKPISPDGGMFLVADWTHLEGIIDVSSEKNTYKDIIFTKWLIKNVGVQVIPTSIFYGEARKKFGEQFVRFCFIKDDDCLRSVAKILQNWSKKD